MKKILSVSLLTASLLAGGTGIIHAEEQPATKQKLTQTPEYQELQSLLQQKKKLNAELKAQSEKNQALWDTLRGDVPQEVRDAVKKAMAEIKPMREENKNLVIQMKEAKKVKDKEKVAELKAKIEANHQAIDAKLTPLESELAQVKELHQKLKEPLAEIKPIREAKKANHEKALQVKQEWKETIKSAKNSFKNGDESWKSSLTEAIALIEQLTDIKTEILSQKASIYDSLQ